MKFKNAINWPAKPENSMYPWYVIIWRMPFLLLSLIFIFLTGFVILVATMNREAARDWIFNALDAKW